MAPGCQLKIVLPLALGPMACFSAGSAGSIPLAPKLTVPPIEAALVAPPEIVPGWMRPDPSIVSAATATDGVRRSETVPSRLQPSPARWSYRRLSAAERTRVLSPGIGSRTALPSGSPTRSFSAASWGIPAGLRLSLPERSTPRDWRTSRVRSIWPEGSRLPSASSETSLPRKSRYSGRNSGVRSPASRALKDRVTAPPPAAAVSKAICPVSRGWPSVRTDTSVLKVSIGPVP